MTKRINITAHTPDGVWHRSVRTAKDLKKVLTQLPPHLDLDVQVWVGRIKVTLGGYYLLRRDVLPL